MISPFVGILLDRFGPRLLMTFGVALTGGSFILLSRVNSLWQFYAAISLLTVGMSFGTFIVLVTAVSNWFVRRRARALAILMSASAAGAFALPLLVSSIDSFGWRDVMFAVGIGFWIVGFPATLTMRRRPEEYGLLPDGDKQPESGADSGRTRRPLRREMNFGVRQTLRTRFFWQFALATGLGQLVSSTNLLHLSALKDYGVSPGVAAIAAASVAFGDFAGRISIGFVGDRFDKRWLLGGAYGLMALGSLAFSLVNAKVLGVSLGLAPLPVFAIALGAGFGASIPLRFTMLADYFGRRSYGSIIGITSSVGALFGAVGPVFVGLTFDVVGAYRPAFLILSLVVAGAVPLTLTLERPGRVAARIRRSARELSGRRAPAGRTGQ